MFNWMWDVYLPLGLFRAASSALFLCFFSAVSADTTATVVTVINVRAVQSLPRTSALLWQYDVFLKTSVDQRETQNTRTKTSRQLKLEQQ